MILILEMDETEVIEDEFDETVPLEEPKSKKGRDL